MKVLLDECVTKRLKPHLKDLEVYTVVEMGWSGMKNGKYCHNVSVIISIFF